MIRITRRLVRLLRLQGKPRMVHMALLLLQLQAYLACSRRYLSLLLSEPKPRGSLVQVRPMDKLLTGLNLLVFPRRRPLTVSHHLCLRRLLSASNIPVSPPQSRPTGALLVLVRRLLIVSHHQHLLLPLGVLRTLESLAQVRHTGKRITVPKVLPGPLCQPLMVSSHRYLLLSLLIYTDQDFPAQNKPMGTTALLEEWIADSKSARLST
ncbi:hypothetical protein DER44DRAFT_761497 [Fusarium oxysporum]|nr:hypothetical protein DER44DRAFT_761497 [Fusarium oxysporum]